MPKLPSTLPIRPAHPERTCWGCDKYCPAEELACGNGTIRALHPIELFGEDWLTIADADAARSDDRASDPNHRD